MDAHARARTHTHTHTEREREREREILHESGASLTDDITLVSKSSPAV